MTALINCQFYCLLVMKIRQLVMPLCIISVGKSLINLKSTQEITQAWTSAHPVNQYNKNFTKEAILPRLAILD